MLQRADLDNQLPNHHSNRLPSKPITFQNYLPSRLPFNLITFPTDYHSNRLPDYHSNRSPDHHSN
ncbi:MAG: hypothetical protein LKG19_01505 [Saprospiraceae bacterium]|nr:hypothetical protein [Saprospiraceae bacterium]